MSKFDYPDEVEEWHFERLDIVSKIPTDRLREIAEAERDGQLLVVPKNGIIGVSFTKPGEQPCWTFRGYPQEDGSFMLAICKSDTGTSVETGELIPENESDSFHPVLGLRFYQKASVMTLKKACEDIVRWFDSQKAEPDLCSGCVHRGEEICGSCARNGRGNDTDFYREK